MKGQFSVEQLISLSLFILFVTYLFFQFFALRPTYLKEVRNEIIRSETYQISEVLINDPGYPVDWNLNPSQTKRIGLLNQTLNKTNLLSIYKINEFNIQCAGNGYYNVKKWLDTDYNFSIFLTDRSTDSLKISCYPPSMAVKGIKTTVRRIVAFNDTYGELILQMW